MSLSVRQKKALVLLIFERDGGKVARSRLQKSAGLPPQELAELEAGNYVSREPVRKGAFRVVAADRAWNEVPGFLAETGIFAKKAPLDLVLQRLAIYLHHTGCSLQEFMNPPKKELAEELVEKATARDAEAAIRKAYLELTGGRFHEYVPLRNLRPRLSEFPRAGLDERLQSLQLDRKLLLMMDENPQTITRADQEAAVRVGGIAKHFIVIEA